MCSPTFMSGISPLLMGMGVLHKGHTGTCTSYKIRSGLNIIKHYICLSHVTSSITKFKHHRGHLILFWKPHFYREYHTRHFQQDIKMEKQPVMTCCFTKSPVNKFDKINTQIHKIKLNYSNIHCTYCYANRKKIKINKYIHSFSKLDKIRQHQNSVEVVLSHYLPFCRMMCICDLHRWCGPCRKPLGRHHIALEENL